jgi:hypothetical protein
MSGCKVPSHVSVKTDKVSQIDSVIEVPIAILSNTPNSNLDTVVEDLRINLNPVYLEYSSFLKLYYSTFSGNFLINVNNANNDAILFSKSTYKSFGSDKNLFSLTDELLRAYQEKNKIITTNLPASLVLFTRREVRNINSLANFTGTCIGENLFEVLSDLVNSHLIEATNNVQETVSIKFQVVSYIKSETLGVTISVYSNYIVDVPGFRNKTSDDASIPYSKNVDCKKKFSFNENLVNYETISNSSNDESLPDLKYKNTDNDSLQDDDSQVDTQILSLGQINQKISTIFEMNDDDSVWTKNN